MNQTIPDNLLPCLQSGFDLVKGRPHEKKPQVIGWRTASRCPEENPRHVTSGGNAGWRLGAADPDACPHMLAGSGSHYYYLVKIPKPRIANTHPNYPSFQFRAPDKS